MPRDTRSEKRWLKGNLIMLSQQGWWPTGRARPQEAGAGHQGPPPQSATAWTEAVPHSDTPVCVARDSSLSWPEPFQRQSPTAAPDAERG